MYMQPQIILLREGTDTSQGKGQLISNINACTAVVDSVRTTLGPRGMDKLVTDRGGKTTVSNDGATIMELLEIVHPAAQALVDIAKAQDDEVGDGTTSVVLLAGTFLAEAKQFVEDNVHPQIIIAGYRKACDMALAKVKELAFDIKGKDEAENRVMLERCASTALSSKLIASHRDLFATMVVKAVLLLDDANLSLDHIGIKRVTGGGVEESVFVEGVAFKKTFSYAGFEQQPKAFKDAKVILLNLELELKNEKENAEIRINDPKAYQSIVDAEWSIIYDKLDKIAKSGAKVVLSKLPIGDLATQYFADRGIFCAGRVEKADLARVAMATGATVQSTVNDLKPEVLGTVGDFSEKQIGGERYNLFTKCPKTKTATIILRGGAEEFIAEAERSLHDAIMIVRRAVKNHEIVAGGGAIEMELSRVLREHARTIHGKQQLIINAFAKALEVIPRQLSENGGLDPTDILNKLRHKHATGGQWFGVDLVNDDIANNYDAFVWEPTVMKLNALKAATEAACLILSVDETVKNPKSQMADKDNFAGLKKRRRGMPGMPGPR